MDKTRLEHIELGKTGLMISPLGLGTVKFGRNEQVKYPQSFEIPDEDFLADLLSLAQDLGVNMLDTAPAYGASEERLGRLLKGQRKDWVIVGKAGEEFENSQSHYDFTPDHFKRSLERSLKRLDTDYIDMLLIHSDGSDMDILNNDKLIRTLEDFKTQGLVRAIGASTKTVKGGIKTLELMDVVMASYNPLHKDEEPVLDYAAQNNKGAILKKALSSGHITDPQEAFDFAFSHKGTSGIIVGTINPEHLKQNVSSAQKAIVKYQKP